MNVQQRERLLKKIYTIHDAYASDDQAACHLGCNLCCTCNVTATTLEGFLIYRYLGSVGLIEHLKKMIVSASAKRFRPQTSLNEMVALCVQGKSLPLEYNDPSAGVCPFLHEDLCSIYPVRPLGCRALISTSKCRLGSQAQMPPLILTVNNVVMQYIEALDRPGWTGNIIDVLRLLSVDTHREAYLGGRNDMVRQDMRINKPIPVLMVPPEHRQAIQPLVQSIQKAIHGDQVCAHP